MLTTRAYILGKSRFCDLDFVVNEAVLVPRFETEILVKEALDLGKKSILDLCTGSGCIGVALAKQGIDVTASDISTAALTVARTNAMINAVNINIVQSDLFENIKGKFDVIVSNPPYIKTSEIGIADPQTLKEPRIALDGGKDGLEFYRRIAKDAQNFLNAGGVLLMEIGWDQANDIRDLLESNNWGNIEFVKDHNGYLRVVKCTKN